MATPRILLLLLPSFLSLPPLASIAQAQGGAAVLTFAKAGSGGAANDYLAISLADGRGDLIDRLEREPLDLRSRALTENLFQAIGRSQDQSAKLGEIFFAPITNSDGSVRAALYVESPIGYAAYFEDPGKGAKLGKITTLVTRPFQEIAAADANFALLMRKDTAGRTEGAYLYHGTTGKSLYLDGLRKLETSPDVRPTSSLPTLDGPISAAPIHVGSEATAAYLVLDSATGDLYFFDLSADARLKIRPLKLEMNIYDAISREGSYTSSRRFELVPVDESRSLTQHVFIADAVTGETAVLQNVAQEGVPIQLRKSTSLGRGLANNGTGERVFSAVPRTTSTGATLGAWLVDSQTRRTVYVDSLGLPEEMTVTVTSIKRK